MHGVKRIMQCGVLAVTAAALTAFSGCQTCERGHECCNDIPPGAIPRPAGTYVCQWEHKQEQLGNQDDFVIYQYEWAADGVTLTPFGKEHMTQIARELGDYDFPVVIEPDDNAETNAARQKAVLAALATSPVGFTSDRVVVARPEAEGLYGQEATGIATRMLNSRNTSSSSFSSQSSLSNGLNNSSSGTSSIGLGLY